MSWFKANILGMTRLLFGSLLFLLLLHFSQVQAGPEGGNIVGGTGSINTQGLTTNIHQNTQTLAVNWNSFDIYQNRKMKVIGLIA